MTLAKLIELLQQAQREHGDIPVEVQNGAGDWDDVGAVELINPFPKITKNIKWAVRIDT